MAKYKFFPFLLLLAFSSCQGFLDIEPQDEISKEEALNDLLGVRTAMIGAYNSLTPDDYYQQRFAMYPEFAGNIELSPNALNSGDIAGTTNFQVVTYREAYSFTVNALYADNSLEEFYSGIYAHLLRANDLITAIPNLEEGTEGERNSLLGEAYMLRAIGHFDLLRLYAQAYNFTPDASHVGVVILPEGISAGEFPARSSVAESYALVVEDLQRAIQLIGPQAQRSTEPIWLSSLAARALLARVYAYMENWEGVVEQASEVINSGQFVLAGSNEYVEAWQQGTLPEIIFELDLQQFVNEDAGSSAAISSSAIVIGAFNQEPLGNVSADLLELYEEEDIRRGLFLANGVGDTLSLKYPLAPNTVNNFPLLRLSEQYLLRAEAYAELGQEEEARRDYDIIHQRALPDAEPTALSGQALRDEIFNERRRELALEGHLLFDLSRKNKDISRKDCLPFNPNCNIEYPDFRYVLPIPQDALVANPGLVQNEGY